MADDALTDDERQRIRYDLLSIIGYTCETQAPNSKPTGEYITDRWMSPRLDALVDYVARARAEGARDALAPVERLADEFGAFDSCVDAAPEDAESPEDYERGVNDCATRLHAAVAEGKEAARECVRGEQMGSTACLLRAHLRGPQPRAKTGEDGAHRG